MDLRGKGVWLAYSYDFQRAVEMATRIEATYLFVKVGHGPHYFPETARPLAQRVRSLGFRGIAWVHITDRAPADALYAIEKALALDYRAVVLYLGQGLVTRTQLEPLTTALERSGVPVEQLLLASPPLSYLPDRTALEALAPFCQGGWMPLCFPQFESSAKTLINREVYQSISDLSLIWGNTPALYPVLSALQGKHVASPFLPEDLIPWVEQLMQHGVDFFSVYHAAATEKALWPILKSAVVASQEEKPSEEITELGPVVPQPEYVTVTTNDTVWGLINRYGMDKVQFWKWNGHLWDSRGLPRDSDYLQAGWRVRVK